MKVALKILAGFFFAFGAALVLIASSMINDQFLHTMFIVLGVLLAITSAVVSAGRG
jgi:hypothetical protein